MSKNDFIAVIDCAGTNLTSVSAALDRLGANYEMTSDIERINNADKVMLPGVGAAKQAMSDLRQNNLVQVIRNLEQPVLGICLGMQLLFEHSTEGDAECLGVIEGTIKHFPEGAGLIVPHMGWNSLKVRENALMAGIVDGDHVYFVHSYYAPTENAIATSVHGVEFAAAVAKGNFFGCQFHPERSGGVGEKILSNFVNM